MNETTIDVDQTDEDILTYTVSDEALEAAAGTGGLPSRSNKQPSSLPYLVSLLLTGGRGIGNVEQSP
jgi:hypothetical protein